jgi:hypothetical protein
MEHERDEVFERIPWETLEKKSSDRHWLIYLGAGAITLGGLAYSFVRNQPAPVATEPASVATTLVAGEPTPEESTTPTAESPVVYSEADLFAIDPEMVMAEAATYAEWFAVEYFSYDGGESAVLAEMLGEGVPLPTAGEGVQVFVDWVGVKSVTQTGPLSYEVDVLVRSLLSTDGAGFARQPVRIAMVPVVMGDDGVFRLDGLPVVSEVSGLAGPGGDQLADVVPEIGPDGVTRPAASYP